MWKCDKCGSTDVHSEWAFMRPMNDPDASPKYRPLLDAGESGFYWCQACDEECDPIREEEEK